MGNNILLSVCIPTYNRSEYLRQCLDSVICQFADENVRKKIEIIISDNASQDNTSEVVKEYIKKYDNIKYFRNDKNTKTINTVTVASYATGTHISFCSDDDLYQNNALATIIQSIEKNNPDVIFCNLDMMEIDGTKSVTDVLHLKHDYFFKNKKNFFRFLSKKFYFTIDWYATFYSILTVKRKFYEDNLHVISKYRSELHEYPHEYPIYYTDDNFTVKILAKPLIIVRKSDNQWGFKRKVDYEFQRHRLLSEHYKNIIKVNKSILPFSFIIDEKIKRLIRLLKIFAYKIYILK